MVDKHTAPALKRVGLFRPLKHRQFSHLFIANFMANIGSWMQIFATGWLVASQTKDPALASLAQTLTQIPIFLFSVIGGVFADRYNTFKYLGGINSGMALSTTLLAIITCISLPTINILFLFTFIIATGTALKASAWQATMSSIVPREEIEAAATLNGLSYNLASIVGPVLGAMLFLAFGAGTLYFTNALCLFWLATIYFLNRKNANKKPPLMSTSILSLLNEGVKVSITSPQFRDLLLSTILLFFSISTFQALLPAYITLVLKADSHILSMIMAAFGSGAVISAFALPTIRARYPRHVILTFSALIYSLFLMSYSLSLPLISLMSITVMGGGVWAAIVSTMNSAAQSVFASHIRARALSIYSMCFYGALTIGSLTWGQLAGSFGIKTSFLFSGIILIASSIYVFGKIKLPVQENEHSINKTQELSGE